MFIDVKVGFELTSYTISELRNSEEICINSDSPGISAEFEINVKTNLTSEFRHWNQSMVYINIYSVLFSVSLSEFHKLIICGQQ